MGEKREIEVKEGTMIVSMTSWPPRINAVPNAFNAVLGQIEEGMDVHCVLCLCEQEFPNKEQDLPKEVLDLDVEILWTERNTRSHKKLMPTMKKYPDNPIIVIDDDTCQTEGWLKTFIEDHKRYPNDIIFGQSTSVVHVSIDDTICEVRNGKCYEIPGAVAYTQKPASGAAGTLFPPHIFTREEFYDEDLMMELSPTCDETWQWAFALMEGRTIRALSRCNLPMVNHCDQECSLIHTNRITINKIHAAIAKRFPEYKAELKRRQGFLVAGLYSHDVRLQYVHKTIESLLNQSIRPARIVLNIPKGQASMLSEEAKQMVTQGFVEINEVAVDFRQHNKYLYTMLKYPGSATLLFADNCIYPEDTISTLWVKYLENPCNVYAGETKIIALDNDSNPMEYEHWGTHGRLYKNYDGYKDQMALATGGILIPPSTISDTFNKKALTDYIDAGNTLLQCSIIASGLSVAKAEYVVERHSDLPDEEDSAECVNRLIKEYRVI